MSILSPFVHACIGTVLVLASLSVSFAQVMNSSNYQIQSDSINVSGGLSTSSNYMLEATQGEIASGDSDSDNYSLRAGFQQMQEVYISLTGVQSVALSPSIPGITGGTANGSTTLTVITDSPAGYELSISTETNPAMIKGSDSISDYNKTGNPDFTFATGPADSHFGYSPEGADIVSKFRDDGNNCGSGSFDTALSCWEGLSTTQETIATYENSNHPLGSTTTIRFRVGVGGSVAQPPGVYTATTTITALPL